MGAMENVTTIKEYHLPAEAKEILHSLATKWEDVVDPNALQVIPLKGVMTNQVFQIKWPTKTEKLSRVVLIRIYGEGVDIFFDRNVEIRTFECMSKHKQGPRLLGRFLNGRIEEFIHARDYEYASYNSVAYDIANHFCEMASDYHTETPHIVDYSKYPGLEERQRFVYKYLSSLGGTATEIEVKQLVELVEKYTLASHLVWGLWGIISYKFHDQT